MAPLLSAPPDLNPLLIQFVSCPIYHKKKERKCTKYKKNVPNTEKGKQNFWD
jgi:hypothetical protein